MTNQYIRSFISLELPETLKAHLGKIQTSVKSNEFTFVKWVVPESIHLTLKFLGNVQIQKVEQIVQALTNVAACVAPFKLETAELGVFPDLDRPSVFWVGLGGEIKSLIVLQKNIDDALEPLGFQKEKRAFTPHLTLARLREAISMMNKRDFSEAIKRIQFDVRYKWEIRSVCLIRSQLSPQGAIYSSIAEIGFCRHESI